MNSAGSKAAFLPDPSAYALEGRGQGRRVGVLLVHGFTASATETRPFAEYLSRKAGWACRGVLLAGHGRTIDDLHDTDRFDWVDSARQGFEELQEQGCQHHFLVGVSMGSCICCLLAAEHPSHSIRGLALMAPAFALPTGLASLSRVAGWLIKNQYKGDKTVEYFRRHRLFSYHHRPLPLIRQVVQLGSEAMTSLSAVRSQTLMLVGAKDGMISKKAVYKACGRIPACRVAVLENSEHILTVEPDAEKAFQESLGFMQDCLEDFAASRNEAVK